MLLVVLGSCADPPVTPEADAGWAELLRRIYEADPLRRPGGVSTTVTPDDVATVVAAGHTEEAVYDAITLCDLFTFYKKWIDATGMSDIPAVACRMSSEQHAGTCPWRGAQ